MSNRARRVLVYTAALLIAPLPVIPHVPGTREFALALLPCGTILSVSSFYVARGEMRSKGRDLLGNKLIASSVITLLFGVSILVGSIGYLLR
jgi:hypothetical protein